MYWELKPSDLHGIGVFAGSFYEAESLVDNIRCRVAGKVVDFKQPPLTGVVSDDEILAVVSGFPLWYCNYSSTPNIEVRMMSARFGEIIALRRIEEGEELTIEVATIAKVRYGKGHKSNQQ